jgi:CubicO group peptidase (beta-lactamase class C family)
MTTPDGEQPVGPNTPFEAASLSKTVFATLFVEALTPDGLALDASLASTGVPRRVTDAKMFEGLTPRLVLSHQTGLPNWAGDARDPARDDPLEFQRPPGTGFGYSGEGYELLKAHATATLGHGLEEWFIARRDELGMPESSYRGPAPGADGTVAKGPDDGSVRPLSASDHELAAASLITTAADYGRFLQYLLSRRELLDTLLDPQVRVDEAGTGNVSWGLGWGIYRREDYSQVAFHWGDNYQFKAFVAIDPEALRAVVFFANGFEGLRLVPTIVEPVVGDLRPVRDWLSYEE